MYTKHFFKMLIGLILMAAIGIAGLVIANHYSKDQSVPATGIAQSVSLPG